MKKLLLASSSKPRRDLLSRLKIPFEHYAPDIDESQLDNESVYELVTRLSVEKAKAGATRYPDHICIGGDQVAFLPSSNTILGKPHDFNTAVNQLKQMSEKTVFFLAGICIYTKQPSSYKVDVIPTEVTFKKLNQALIEDYLRKEEPYKCAGSFKSEGLAISLCTKISSNDPSAIMGLPLITLSEYLSNYT